MKGKYFFYIIFLFFPFFSYAASINFSPNTGTYKIGETFSIYVNLNTENKSINAVSLNISFPKNILRVISVSKSDSIINYWISEPTFSNENGRISFEGVRVNPGFDGSNGRLIKITFEAKSSGIADLSNISASVLANDGLGTNVLRNFNKGLFTIGQTVAVSTTPSSLGTPSAIFISSVSHPDPNEWYSLSNVDLSWQIPQIVESLSYELDQNSSTNPGSVAMKKVNSFSQKNLTDGIWFFHLRGKNENGWGAVSHFRIQIDTTPPGYVSIKDETEKEGRRVFKIESQDNVSGIKNYEIRIDGGEPYYLNGADITSFTAPILVAGKHTIFVKAFDFAGNHTANSIDFESTGLVPPKIIEYPNELSYGDRLKIVGISAPNHDVVITLVRQSRKAGFSQEINYFSDSSKINLPVEKKLVRSGSDGVFRYVWEKKLLAGNYRIYAFVVDKEGNESLPSDQIIFDVEESNFVKLISFLTGILSLVIPFIGIVLFGILMILYLKKKYKNLKVEINQDLDDTQKDIGKVIKKAEETANILETVEHHGPKPKEEVLILKEHQKELGYIENSLKQRILNLRKKLMGK